ncbi:hypothetical protein [Legionella pneumophila]
MDGNYIAYQLEVDEVGLKEKRSSEGVTSKTIKDIKQKIDQTFKNVGWVIFKKNGNQYELCELYKP